MMQKIWAQHNKVRKNNKGFSLVELIIVIAIMAALVAILAPQYIKYVERSRETADQGVCSELLHAVQVAAVDPSFTGTKPTSVVFTISTTGVIAITGITDGTAAPTTNFADLVASLVDVKSTTMKSTDAKAFTSLTVLTGPENVTWDAGSATNVAKLTNGVAGS